MLYRLWGFGGSNVEIDVDNKEMHCGVDRLSACVKFSLSFAPPPYNRGAQGVCGVCNVLDLESEFPNFWKMLRVLPDFSIFNAPRTV